jgi:NCS2 family nucleobase:cation symporter-2
VQYLPDGARVLMVAGLLPSALIAIVLPEELSDEATEDGARGLSGHGTYGHPPEDAVRVTARA